MFSGRRSRVLAKCAFWSLAILPFCATNASAQASDPREAGPDDQPDGRPEIVVTGSRGSAITDIAPIATLDAAAVAATGASTMPELLQAIRGSTQGADGGEPIFLLNAQRVSGYQEIGSLPPEAIEKVEVLPEQAALKFGFPPTRRVVNFITKRPFRQIQLRGTAGTTTRAGSATEKANVDLTRLRGDGRLTLALEYGHTGSVLQSERNIDPDPFIPFDAIGNVLGIGGEIDPALSAAAGQAVTIAGVPDNPADRTSLAGYVAGANRPRLFDLGPYRTLAPENDTVKAQAVVADRIGGTLAGSLTLSAEQSRDRSLGGLAAATLFVPESNPSSPFAEPVLLDRYLIETGVLAQSQTTTTLSAGFTLRGAISGWRWDVTGTFNQKQIDSRAERGIDMTAANAAIAGGANPFLPLDASLLGNRLIDLARQRTRSAGVKAVVTNTPVRLPAGRATVTATLEADHASADSSTRGPNPFDLHLARGRVEGGIAVDLPLASRREDVLPFIGELSFNASFNARAVGGFGSLSDRTYGINWGPIDGVQLLANVRHSEVAPDMAQQSTPVVRVENVAIFDFGNGRTELVTLVQGGNPDLLAERRVTRSLTLSVKPFAKQELRLGATYQETTIRDQTGTVYALTPRTEADLPDLFTRDPAGRLVSVAYRPINFSLERQRTLNFTLNANGRIGKAPPPPQPGKPPLPQANYYGGLGPSIRLSDRLQLRPGAPELDLLRGDTIAGWSAPRVSGYAYGGINYLGNGMNFNGWYGGASRVRSADPAGDLHFSPILKINVGAYLSVHHFLKDEEWTSHMQLRLDVTNLTDDRQNVRDGNGDIPNRFQRDYLDPIGRTVTLSLRKLF